MVVWLFSCLVIWWEKGRIILSSLRIVWVILARFPTFERFELVKGISSVVSVSPGSGGELSLGFPTAQGLRRNSKEISGFTDGQQFCHLGRTHSNSYQIACPSLSTS